MAFAQKLDELLTERGLSAYRISKDTGISDRLIGYWRKGEKKPTLENIAKLSEYLGVSVDWLLADDNNINRERDIWELMNDFPALWKLSNLDGKNEILLALMTEVIAVNNSKIPPEWIKLISNHDKNIIGGDVVGSAFVQGTNKGNVTVHNGHERTISDEAVELLKLYEGLPLKKRVKLLQTAIDLSESED